MREIDRKSERIEREALVSLHEHCPSDLREPLGLFLLDRGDAVVAGASRDPSILLNRCLGLGTRRAATGETVATIARDYRDRGVDRYFLHIYPDALPADQGLAWKQAAGLESVRGWMKFSRGTERCRDRSTDLRIERIGRDKALDFGRIVAGAFGMTPAAAGLMAGLADDPRWHLFVSYDGDTPAGAGSLMVDDGVGWLEWGATAPEFRQRGSQGAILAARIRTALDLGCSHLFTETGEAVPGDPQHSYANIQRFGFKESVLRLNWAPLRPVAS